MKNGSKKHNVVKNDRFNCNTISKTRHSVKNSVDRNGISIKDSVKKGRVKSWRK